MFESQAGDHDNDTADVDDVSDPTPGWHPTPPWGTRGSPPHIGVSSLSVSRGPGEWEAATRTCLTQTGPSGASHSFSSRSAPSRSAPNTTHPFRNPMPIPQDPFHDERRLHYTINQNDIGMHLTAEVGDQELLE